MSEDESHVVPEGDDGDSGDDGQTVFLLVFGCPITVIYALERIANPLNNSLVELTGYDIPRGLALRTILLRPLFARYYSDYGRSILEEQLLNIPPRFGYDGDSGSSGYRYLDEMSQLIPLENPGLDVGPMRSGPTEFLEPYRPSIRAAMRTFLLPNYSTLAERYTTHFRVWFVPHFRAQLFSNMREVVETQSSASEIADLRNVREITPEEEAAFADNPHLLFESYIRSRIRAQLLGLSVDEIDSLRTEIYTDGIGLDSSCVICLEPFDQFEEIVVLMCNHGFHIDCVRRWLRISNTCPSCRGRAMERDEDLEE